MVRFGKDSTRDECSKTCSNAWTSESALCAPKV